MTDELFVVRRGKHYGKVVRVESEGLLYDNCTQNISGKAIRVLRANLLPVASAEFTAFQGIASTVFDAYLPGWAFSYDPGGEIDHEIAHMASPLIGDTEIRSEKARSRMMEMLIEYLSGIENLTTKYDDSLSQKDLEVEKKVLSGKFI